MTERKQPEPWLRGTLVDDAPVPRAVLQALELAEEDLDHFCGDLSDAELNVTPLGLPPVAFHLKHIARSLDRRLNYAEGSALSPEQIASLKSEFEKNPTRDDLFAELHSALAARAARIRRIDPGALDQTRSVGSKQLPTTVAGLLVHVADHTQRGRSAKPSLRPRLSSDSARERLFGTSLLPLVFTSTGEPLSWNGR